MAPPRARPALWQEARQGGAIIAQLSRYPHDVQSDFGSAAETILPAAARVVPLKAAKALARAAALIVILPALGSFYVRRLVLGADRALLGSSQALSLLPGVLGQYARTAFYRCVLAHGATSVVVEFGAILSKVGARLDDNVYVGPMCHLGLVHLERDVLVAAGVHIPSGPMTHGVGDLQTPIRDQPGVARCVRVGAGSWIGSAGVGLADVGPDPVRGGGAVVTKPIPAAVIAAGVPAAVIRARE